MAWDGTIVSANDNFLNALGSTQSHPRPQRQTFKVVKYATGFTAQKLINADLSGQVAAIGKSQAVIEFRRDGAIVSAKGNFLNTLDP